MSDQNILCDKVLMTEKAYVTIRIYQGRSDWFSEFIIRCMHIKIKTSRVDQMVPVVPSAESLVSL